MYRKSGCFHRRIKKNYPFGRHSKAQKTCKDCGKLVTNKELRDRKPKHKKIRW